MSGDKWNGTEGFSIPSYPNGIINRRNYGGGVTVSHTNWSSVVSTANMEPLIIKLDVTTNYDTTVKALNTSIKATFKATYTNTIKVSVILIEDEIVGLQDDHGVETEDYEFEHMMRGTINGDWGTDLKAPPIVTNDTVRVSFNDFSITGLVYTPTTKPIVVNDKHVSVVVFVFDAITREVLQVEKVKIR